MISIILLPQQIVPPQQEVPGIQIRICSCFHGHNCPFESTNEMVEGASVQSPIEPKGGNTNSNCNRVTTARSRNIRKLLYHVIDNQLGGCANTTDSDKTSESEQGLECLFYSGPFRQR